MSFLHTIISKIPPSDPTCNGVSESQLSRYLWIPLAVQCLIVIGLLIRASNQERKSGMRMFPMYWWMLVALCPFWIIRAILMMILTSNSTMNAITQLAIVEPLVGAVREGVAFFLCQTGAGRNSVRRTVLLAFSWFILLFGLACLGLMWGQGSSSSSFLKAPYLFWFLSDGGKFALYLGLLLFWFRPSNVRARRSRNWIYPVTMCVLYAGFISGDLLTYTGVTSCVNLAAEALYYCVWPVLTFVALLFDSNYWRNVGRPAWSASSVYGVVQRLSGPRSEFEALLDHDGLEADKGKSDNQLTDAHIIDFARLKILRRIGEKTQNVELLAAFLDGEPVCVKRFAVEELEASTVNACVREITITACLPKHRNIALLYGVCVVVPSLCVVCEYAAHGTLQYFLQRRKREHQVRLLTRKRRNTGSSGSLASLFRSAGGALSPTASSASLSDDNTNSNNSNPTSSTLDSPQTLQPPTSYLFASGGDSNDDLAFSLSGLSVGDYASMPRKGTRSNTSHNTPDRNTSFSELDFMPAEMKLRFARDLSRAVAFLHSQQPAVYHSDIASRHCLVANGSNGNFVLKLTDFGTTRRLASQARRRDRRSRGGVAADVAAMGVVFHELMTGHMPSTVEIAVLQRDSGSARNFVATTTTSQPKINKSTSDLRRSKSTAALRSSRGDENDDVNSSELMPASGSTQHHGSVPQITISGGDNKHHNHSNEAIVAAGTSKMPPAWRALLRDCWAVKDERLDAPEVFQRLQRMTIHNGVLIDSVENEE